MVTTQIHSTLEAAGEEHLTRLRRAQEVLDIDLDLRAQGDLLPAMDDGEEDGVCTEDAVEGRDVPLDEVLGIGGTLCSISSLARKGEKT